jgi:hypothetical protein
MSAIVLPRQISQALWEAFTRRNRLESFAWLP